MIYFDSNIISIFKESPNSHRPSCTIDNGARVPEIYYYCCPYVSTRQIYVPVTHLNAQTLQYIHVQKTHTHDLIKLMISATEMRNPISCNYAGCSRTEEGQNFNFRTSYVHFSSNNTLIVATHTLHIPRRKLQLTRHHSSSQKSYEAPMSDTFETFRNHSRRTQNLQG